MSDKSGTSQWDSSELVTDIGLQSDQALQKFLARRVSHERELRLELTNEEMVEGFVTAFDADGWFQVSIPEEKTHDILLRREQIVSIEETGKSLKEFEPLVQARIRDYSRIFKSKCEEAIKRVPRSNYNNVKSA